MYPQTPTQASLEVLCAIGIHGSLGDCVDLIASHRGHPESASQIGAIEAMGAADAVAHAGPDGNDGGLAWQPYFLMVSTQALRHALF